MIYTKETEEKVIVECPFNPAHKIQKEKIQFHINRCKDGKKNAHLFATCDYNSFHIMKKTEIEEHMKTCPDRKKREYCLELARKMKNMPTLAGKKE